MALQIRRGTNAERLNLTDANGTRPLAGELLFVTDYDTANVSSLWVGTGNDDGGVPVDTTLAAQYLNLQTNITPNASNTFDIGTSSKAWRTGYFNGIVASGEIEAASFHGNIVSDSSTVVVNANAGTVTANVTGTLTGDTKASDNSTIIDHTAKTITGTSIGTHKGTVNADDNSLRIDGASDRITNSVLDFDGNVITLATGNGIQIGTNNSAQGVGFEIYNTDHTARNALRIYSDAGNSNTFNSIEAYASRGSIVTPTINAADDSLFGYIHHGYDGTQYVQSSYIVAGIDSQASVGVGAMPGNILLGTTPDNGSTVNSVVINKDGNLGVNTLTPSKKLVVNGNAQVVNELLLGNMDQTAINALTGANGMIVYNTTSNKFQGYENGAWANLI